MTSSPNSLRAAGDRIEQLLEASSAGGTAARERAEELVRLVVELYGAGLERTLDIVHDAGQLSDDLLDQLADDDLVASLLLVHGLHPHSIETRVERALEKVRPYLGSHGGDVELLGVTDDVVQLRMLGTCDGCPSSAVTLKLAVEGAIQAAAPEIVHIEVESADGDPARGDGAGSPATFIPVESLSVRLRETASPPDGGLGEWEPVDGAVDLLSGSVRRFAVGQVDVAIARVGKARYAYRDECPACSSTLAGAALERTPGAPVGSAVLRCPGCGDHYDVQRAGAGVDSDRHLDPLPLLEREGAVHVAVPAAVGT